MSAASPSSSAASTIPSGCHAGDFRPGHTPTMNDSFYGCVVNNSTALEVCCTEVGSTAVFVNETCGCPFNAAFPIAFDTRFFDCVDGMTIVNNTISVCGKANAASGASLRWTAAMVSLGVALVVDAAGLV
ncbi:hypothetical protein DFH09DRAFT_1320370 [Mycena vulgaris]|nr:hypothetical protein DFH09DRAFT_1320370 [Mycena vulgaris]